MRVKARRKHDPPARQNRDYYSIAQRIGDAQRAIDAGHYEQPLEACLAYLMADLHHLADQEGIDVDDVRHMAELHYTAEIADEIGPENMDEDECRGWLDARDIDHAGTTRDVDGLRDLIRAERPAASGIRTS